MPRPCPVRFVGEPNPVGIRLGPVGWARAGLLLRSNPQWWRQK
jgi:hypothetical protein